MVEEGEKQSSGGRWRWRWLVDVGRWLPSPAEFQAAAALLPPHDRPAIHRFVREDDRKRALVSRLLQYSLVHHALGIPLHQIRINRTLEGKSCLTLQRLLQQNENVTVPGFNFSTSHQGDYVGIASEPLCLVGLDIVSISKPQGETALEFINNFTSYLTDHEWNCIVSSGSPDEMLIQFYRYWCLKEAFVKATGAGVGFGLQRLEFHHINWTDISLCIDGKEARKWRFWLFSIGEVHLASIAKGHPEDAVDSFRRTLSDVVIQDEELHTALEIPEEAFTFWTVEQLIQLAGGAPPPPWWGGAGVVGGRSSAARRPRVGLRLRRRGAAARRRMVAGGPRSSRGPIGDVLERPMEEVRTTYSIGKELGRGQFGVTHLCTHKATGEKLACKTIAKRKLANKEDIDDVRREVQIMHHLSGQPNIVDLRGAYEDKHNVHLVSCLPLSTPLQASIAKGHPEDAVDSFRRTLSDVVIQDEELHTALEIPEEAFTFWTVEQLIQLKPAGPIGDVLERPMEEVRTTYSIGKELGRGQFGVTHLCTHKATGEKLACKTIAKRKLANKEDIDDVRREVQIMHHLSGQPNIVDLRGAYEDKHNVHLVMELCAGGELFDRIIARGHYTERAAAALLRAIVGIVHTCHSMGVIHRDLKPENFLLLSKGDDAPLKATDFGLSVFFKEGEVFRDIVGSAYYIAPEVLKRKYGPEADIWSIGVMLYIFLAGVPPFWAESENAIFTAILRGQIDLASEPWPKISSGAKDLVRKMLNINPKERLTAFQVLNHPWIKEDGDAPDVPLDNVVLNRLKQFRAMNQFKKAALRIIAGCLSEEEIKGLKEMFKNIDKDNSGTITLEELKNGLAKQGTKFSDNEIEQLMEAVSPHAETTNFSSVRDEMLKLTGLLEIPSNFQADADGNGMIDYEEFVTATVHMNKMDREEHLYTAFQYFDKDNSGYITKEELEQALKEQGLYDAKEIKDVITDADSNNDGRIDYSEFVAMMRKGSGCAEASNPKKKRRDLVL
uniref:non-specific serine/threonine protein kinase n=1 Tax=Oryza punctata TaxID=4537 RepID=A0A0E0MC66_ORYPU